MSGKPPYLKDKRKDRDEEEELDEDQEEYDPEDQIGVPDIDYVNKKKSKNFVKEVEEEEEEEKEDWNSPRRKKNRKFWAIVMSSPIMDDMEVTFTIKDMKELVKMVAAKVREIDDTQ